MSDPKTKKSITILAFVALFVIFGTIIISLLARGYRLNINGGLNLKTTGLLSVTSSPRSASVLLDDRLITATDDTLNLPPDQYQVKITKDGYIPWQKDIQIKKEIVYQTDATLFRSVPDLKPITLAGAINPALSPNQDKIIYAVASASAVKDNGLYLLELKNTPLPLNRNTARLIASNFQNVNWSDFSFTFSPDSSQVLAQNQKNGFSYLLDLNRPITQSVLFDITPRLSIIKTEWATQEQELIATKINQIPEQLLPFISTDSAQNFTFNTEEDKLFYLATQSGQIPDKIITPPPAQSTQDQTRSIEPDHYYVYDLKDDTNFLIGQKSDLQNPFWLPYSNHIIYVTGSDIKVVEYDSTNQATLYSGQFNTNLVAPWSDGTRIVTLTAPYQGATDNLYSITIR